MAIAPAAEQLVDSAAGATVPFPAAAGSAWAAATPCGALQYVSVSASAPVRQRQPFSRARSPPQPCSAQTQELAMLARFPAAAGCLSYIRTGFLALRRAHLPGTDPYARPATSSFH